MDSSRPKKTPDTVCPDFLGLHLRQLRATARLALATLLFAAVVAYAILLLSAYVHLTPSHSLAPRLRELEITLFHTQIPTSRIERLLESSEGEMNRGGTMRPAFTEQSADWESLTQNMTADERAALMIQRDGERRALLDWVRSGASRDAYERDDYRLRDGSGVRDITAEYLLSNEPTGNLRLTPHVR